MDVLLRVHQGSLLGFGETAMTHGQENVGEAASRKNGLSPGARRSAGSYKACGE